MPFTRELVIDQTHSDDILDREYSLSSISVIIHQSQDSHIGSHIGTKHSEVVVFQMVSQKCVTEHHLSHSDSAAPADIVGQADF